MRALRVIGRIAIRAWLPLVLLAWWWLASAASTSPFFPPLESILGRFGAIFTTDVFVDDVLPSVGAVLVGYLLSCLIAIVVGIVLGQFQRLEAVVDPVLQFLRAIPAVAFIPLVLLIAGIGPQSRVAAIMLGSIWPVLLNTIDGVRSIDPEVRRTARWFRTTPFQLLVRVILPGASAQILTGMRISLSISLVILVANELYAGTNGIGHFIHVAQNSFALADMWAGIILLGVLGYLFSVLFGLAERRLLRWRRPQAGR